ncbi:Yip1 family protein [Rhodovulum sp. YNF3179]|uniref:Yip1 family protein n=1 Tax=Rhodovulum sp. YNF3179 TaxID=3425127 RepID=UPI003D34B585
MLNDMIGLARLSLTAPRDGARAVLSIDLPRQALWMIGALAVVLSVIISQLSTLLYPSTAMGPMAEMLSNPALVLGAHGTIFVVTVLATYQIGRAFGGRGSFDASLKIVAWMQVVMLLVQAAQFVALILFAPLAAMIGLVSIVLFFWIFTLFVTELHGFSSAGAVFAGIVASMIGIIFALSILLGLFSSFIPGVPQSV